MRYVTTFDGPVAIDQIQRQLYELPKGPFPFIFFASLYQIVKRAVVAILRDDVVMSLGLYTFWEDDLDDVACVYRWISGNVHQIMKDGYFFQVGLVICLFLGFFDHLYSDQLVVFDQLIELVIFQLFPLFFHYFAKVALPEGSLAQLEELFVVEEHLVLLENFDHFVVRRQVTLFLHFLGDWPHWLVMLTHEIQYFLQSGNTVKDTFPSKLSTIIAKVLFSPTLEIFLFFILFPLLMTDTPPSQHPQIDLSRYLKYMGIVATAIALSNPIELVKTRLQITPQLLARKTITQPYTTVRSTFQRVVREEGFGGLFKGVQYFLLRTLPSNMGVFTVKELIHRNLSRFLANGDPNSALRQHLKRHFLLVNGAIGSIAGLAIQITIYPFDYFRVILSNEIKSLPDFGLMKAIKEAMHHRGFSGIFNGVLINLVYMSAARGIYFGLYDSYKHSINNEPEKILLSYGSLIAALLTCFPMDTIRKRVIISKNRHRNARECLRHIWREQTLLGLFHGWQVVTLQAGAFCILYYLYDIMFTEIFRSGQKKQ